MTASSGDYHHFCRSSLRSVPADAVFLGARQDPTPSPRQSFCNYLYSEIKNLKERDFLTFRNETVKLLSEIQYKAEERKRQVTKSQEVTTFQLPEASQATAGREYILTIPETQPVSIPLVQPTQTAIGEPVTVTAKVQQPSRPSSASAQLTFYIVMDDQQPWTSRQMIFNPPSVAPSPQEESQQNTSGLSGPFGAILSVLHTVDTPQPFSPAQLLLQPAPSPVSSSTHHEQSRPPSQSSQQSQPKSADYPAQVTPKPALLRATQIFQKQLTSYMTAQNIKHTPSNTYTSPQYMKKIV